MIKIICKKQKIKFEISLKNKKMIEKFCCIKNHSSSLKQRRIKNFAMHDLVLVTLNETRHKYETVLNLKLMLNV